MKKVPLTQGLFALVDDEDYNTISKFKWCAHRPRNVTYASARIGHKMVYLHRFLMPWIPRIDHYDGNGLNNQRSNLRSATRSENGCNRGRNKNNISGFKGVSWFKKTNQWRARIGLDGRDRLLGYFDDPTAAAKTYDKAARRLHGKFAHTNF